MFTRMMVVRQPTPSATCDRACDTNAGVVTVNVTDRLLAEPPTGVTIMFPTYVPGASEETTATTLSGGGVVPELGPESHPLSLKYVTVYGVLLSLLTGTVASERDRMMAEGLVRLTPGVQFVRNDIVVVPAQAK